MTRWLTEREMQSLHLYTPRSSRYVHVNTKTGEWYFNDESGAGLCGPFPTKATAVKAMQEYGESL